MMKLFSILPRSIPRDHWALGAAFLIIAAVGGGGAYMVNAKLGALEQEVTTLKHELALTGRTLAKTIQKTEAALGLELANERAKGEVLRQEVGGVQGAVGTLSGNLDTLKKLSETDPELLAKYSKVYFLSEHYAPPRLAAIDPGFLYREQSPESVDERVFPFVTDLLASAAREGIPLYVLSGYRSFNEQAALKAAYAVTYGSGANTFSADQGYSEHQLGTAVDFITTGLGGNLTGFENTQAYQWLTENAHRFGFTLSYPARNEFYIFEPWHWRFVGVELATLLKNTGRHFYDLDQRDIDAYLISLFSKP